MEDEMELVWKTYPQFISRKF